jgi:hypothetical protein
MSEFIAVRWVKKLKTGPQPEICGLADTGADAKLGGVEIDLSKDVVHLSTRFVLQADLERRVRVAEEVHCFRVRRLRVVRLRPAISPLKIALFAGTWGVRRPVYRMVGAGSGSLMVETAKEAAVDVSPVVKSPG